MKIKDIQVGRIQIPLKKPFKTSLRTVTIAEEIILKVITEEGAVGFGSAPPTAVITGDIETSITGAIKSVIKPKLLGLYIEDLEQIMNVLNSCMIRNSSAKAAVDMALYDLFCKQYNMPLYRLLGGYGNSINTDITISVNSPEEMVRDSIEAVKGGYQHLKVKVGTNEVLDIERVKAIREAVGKNIKIRVDANQGWKPKEAVRIIRRYEDLNLGIELVEQPVIAWDIEGLKFVTDNVETDILADEAVFSAREAIKIVNMRAADLINIKLMKCGGIYNALKICSIAEAMEVECMMGCMMESKVGITAAASFSAAKKNITRYDLDTVLLMAEDPVVGGAAFSGKSILLPEAAGLGIVEVIGWKEL